MIDILSTTGEMVLWWMPLYILDKSTLVQVMAWCRQATSHYLSQCWPRSMSLYGITRPQWVKSSPCNSFTDCSPVCPWVTETSVSDRVPEYRADSRLAPSQWETSLQSNAISNRLRIVSHNPSYGCQATHPICDIFKLSERDFEEA